MADLSEPFVLRLGDFARYRGRKRWSRKTIMDHRYKNRWVSEWPKYDPAPGVCAARRRLRAVELRSDYSFTLVEGTAGFTVHVSSDVNWHNKDLALWQVCRGEAHKIDCATARIVVYASRPLESGSVYKKGLWQQVWLDGQWWPLKLDSRHVAQGMNGWGTVRGRPKARRRRPVPYMRKCDWVDDVVYWPKTGLVASIRLENGDSVKYVCPVTGGPVALDEETTELCLLFL